MSLSLSWPERFQPTSPWLDLQKVEVIQGTQQVFHDLSLRLHPGEHTAILGPNGAGKSALVKLISRELYPVVKPGAWLKLFGSQTVNLWDLRSRIGLVSEDLKGNVPAGVKASDLVLSSFFGSVGLGRAQVPTAEQRRQMAELMAFLDLEDLAERRYGCLSDGQRRRLLLGRALVHGPQVLVLDEPTNGLDLKARYQLLALLRRLAQGGTTVVVATHHIEEIIPEISRCLLLKLGKLVGDGPPSEVLADGPLSALFETPLRVSVSGGYHQVTPAG